MVVILQIIGPVVIGKYIGQVHPFICALDLLFVSSQSQLYKQLKFLLLEVLRRLRNFVVSLRKPLLTNHRGGRHEDKSYAHLRVPLNKLLPTFDLISIMDTIISLCSASPFCSL